MYKYYPGTKLFNYHGTPMMPNKQFEPIKFEKKVVEPFKFETKKDNLKTVAR